MIGRKLKTLGIAAANQGIRDGHRIVCPASGPVKPSFSKNLSFDLILMNGRFWLPTPPATRPGANATSTCSIRTATNCRLLSRCDELAKRNGKNVFGRNAIDLSHKGNFRSSVLIDVSRRLLSSEQPRCVISSSLPQPLVLFPSVRS